MSNVSRSEREQFAQQLEILAETNRMLGKSNEDLRNALSVSLSFILLMLSIIILRDTT